MGKAKRIRVSGPPDQEGAASLHEQIVADRFARPSARNKKRAHMEEENFVDSKLSRRILSEARRQQQELEEEHGQSFGGGVRLRPDPAASRPRAPVLGEDGASSDEEEDAPNEDICEEIVVDEADERAMMAFMAREPKPRRVLADIIMEKIREKEAELQTTNSEAQSVVVVMQDLHPKVREMYEGIRQVLAKYRSGKVPKAFKVIPNMQNWEQLIHVTRPDTWTAAAMYQATRIFSSNLRDNMAQRFYNLVLLPRIRDDVHFYKKLNPHLYLALRKALFKPGAFMKGVVLPLCESGDCTLREAIIMGSVLAKNSVPVLHSAAAMLKIAEMPYTGASSMFLRVLLDKKYALPYRVIDAVHAHFMRFHMSDLQYPVLWHQALLTFVQRYKNDMSSEQRDLLLDLCNSQRHPVITPEVRRELLSAKGRDSAGAAESTETMEL
ncbi:bystin-like [Amphibalanus amphitrite]|uniref:bystin-like n=1 Tax=Amphibalanus amphitrite TaxID=1232801 RepID=UPI001C902677|nr:bystin-like [Amphibalanus amphitrite]XP_043219450.1 bystin-like [Amphibalanus amphitrite]XP_043219451.1 bystin-like [Amphibalanus amphitrite]